MMYTVRQYINGVILETQSVSYGLTLWAKTTTRKTQTCRNCRRIFHPGASMWRPGYASANAVNRSHRLCQECVDRGLETLPARLPGY